MNQLLEIQPSRELKFLFEAKKQSVCNVQLMNRTNQHVAFKVKTTSPKKYCVRPNVGVVLPNETCEFAVIMQAQRSPPSDMNCKDKFLVQSTIVPDGTMENDVTSEMFSKEGGKYVEERKLKVVILSPPHSPELAPMNGKVKQFPLVEDSVVADELLTGREKYSAHDVDEEDAAELNLEDREAQKPKADVSWEPDTEVEDELINTTKPIMYKKVVFQPIQVQESDTVDKLEAKPVITEDLGSEHIELVEPNTVEQSEETPVIMRDDVDSNPVEKLEEKPVKPVIMRDAEFQPIQVVGSNPVEKLEEKVVKPVIMRDAEFQPIQAVESNPVEKLEEKLVKPVIMRDVEFQPIQVVESNSVGKLGSKPMVKKDVQSKPTEVVESNMVEKLEAKSVRGIEPIMVEERDGLRLSKEVEEMKSKLLQLESKLSKAEKTIVKLMEDSRLSFRERQLQEKQLALLKDQRIQKTSLQEEIPLLSVCMVAMLGILIGYLLHR